MRVKKSASEIAIMRKSTEISGLAFKEIMKATAPGMMENQLEAHFEFEIKKRGAQRIAYPPVFASGITLLLTLYSNSPHHHLYIK